jgi:hypothetical protein
MLHKKVCEMTLTLEKKEHYVLILNSMLTPIHKNHRYIIIRSQVVQTNISFIRI